MGSIADITQIDEIADLLIAGRSFRDAWLPLNGPLNSGFDAQGSSVGFISQTLIPNKESHEAVQQEIAELLTDPSVSILRSSSSEYPSRLNNLDGRPALLFVQGDLSEPSKSPLAIVGSRNASPDGLRSAYEVAHRVASNGHLIVSGLASGIDSAGHMGALDGNGRTIAVMGTGLGRVFPTSHQKLAQRIAKHGALVTQFPPMYPSTKTTFPARNVLIAGLSDVSLLIELKEHSGTRIEANCALAQGKRVLLWGPLLESQPWANEFAEHPGAAFVSSAEEVLAELSRSK